MYTQFKQFLLNTQMTDQVAAQLAFCLVPGLFITLEGPLGAGKTSFVRALLRALHITGPIRSPTYTLVEPYETSSLYLYHFDLYRFFDAMEWEAAGFGELFDGSNILLMEWPEKAAAVLPLPDIRLTLVYHNQGRQLLAHSASLQGTQCLTQWQTLLDNLPACDADNS